MDNKVSLYKCLDEYLLLSVQEAFQIIGPNAPKLCSEPQMSDEPCIISSIGFTGTLEGSFSLYLTDSNAKNIVSKMLMTEIEELTADVVDGVSEQLNIIAGGVKMKISGSSQNFDISIPTVIRGNRMVLLSDFKGTSNITHNYKFDDIVFSVSMTYKSKEDDKAEEEKKKAAINNALGKLSGLMNK